MREVKRMTRQLEVLDHSGQDFGLGKFSSKLHQVCRFSRNPFGSSRGGSGQACQHWSQESTISDARASTSFVFTRENTAKGAAEDTAAPRGRYKTQMGFAPRHNQPNDSRSVVLYDDSYLAASQVSTDCFPPRRTRQNNGFRTGKSNQHNIYLDAELRSSSQLPLRSRGPSELNQFQQPQAQ